MRRLVPALAAAALGVVVVACDGTTVIARCPTGVQSVAKRVGNWGNSSLIVCKDGTVWKVNP